MKKRLISFMLLITVISCVGFNTDYFKNLLTLISQAAKEVIYEETESYDEETTDSAVDRLEQELEKLDVRNFFEDESETESGSNTNGIVNGKTPASRLADKLRGLSNSKRPNTVAVVRTADGKYYAGYNKAGIYNGNIQKVLDYLGNNNLYNRQCAEVNAISRAFNDGADLKGATISIANVRKASDVSGVHGTYKAPCDVCQPLIDFFGIEDIK